MRSALICLFFAFIVRNVESQADEDNDFRPTPIPLNNWANENQEPVSTLQESIKTNTSTTVAALPAHYWEDALRHSVYLTLVRDKIDQLITKGVYISPDSKPEDDLPKEVDDHDLWEKIKSAPFDRVKEDFLPPSDTVILARGRLLEEENGYRFAEDDASPQKCNKDNCTLPVKAYWSVKRVRQGEKYPGKYHYELTFSVTSQSPKIVKKPFENPVRTFTIRENRPTEPPPAQPFHRHGNIIQHQRAQRAVWVHKNISPPQKYQKRKESSSGLERLFSSLFSDEDSDDDDDAKYRQKPKSYLPPSHQVPKVHAKPTRYVSDREPYYQKKVYPYPAKPPSFRYPRPPIQPPPSTYTHHSYFDVGRDDPNHEGFNSMPFDPDSRPSISIKTTKPAVLPTPVPNFPLIKESTGFEPFKTTPNSTHTTIAPEMSTAIYKMYNYKPTKVSYIPENIRPPVYNAPPGVFVTMDKKPFKPLPPLKSIATKLHRTLPSDFRPSPQILDSSTETDSSYDTAFKPMTLNLTELVNSKKGPKNHHKPVSRKKPPKKHDNIKQNRFTTASPDIITVSGYLGEGNDELNWAEILAAFSRTTPMASQKDIPIESDTTTNTPTKNTGKGIDEIAAISSTMTPSTSAKSKVKRTRPPPRFKKTEINKKHGHVTTATTSTTTVIPSRPNTINKTYTDLSTQSSFAATNRVDSVQQSKPVGELTNITTSTLATTTASKTPSTSQTSTTRKTYSTTRYYTTPSTTTVTETIIVTTQPKSKNRFRQSTLMQKGTSVNHDKWSVLGLEKNRSAPVPSSALLLRRKASKFQGYIPSSTPRQIEERNREDHIDHAFSSTERENITTTTEEPNEDIQIRAPHAIQPSGTNDVKTNDGWNQDVHDSIEKESGEETDVSDVQDSNDGKEFIFPTESQDNHTISNETVIPLQVTQSNKPKCKKKKHQNLTTTDIAKAPNEVEVTTVTIPTSSITTTTITTTTESGDIPNFLDDLFGGFTMDMDIIDKSKSTPSTTIFEPSESGSSKHEEFVKIDEDVQNFLHSLTEKPHGRRHNEYDEESEDEDSSSENEEDSRSIQDDYYDVADVDNDEKSEPIDILELMAME